MPEATRELVLVGGGHAHVQVLRRFAMDPPPGLRVTLVVDRPVAVYSGMVPGFVAGQYRADELEIDVRPLAKRAGARVVVSAATGIDPEARRIRLHDRPALAYDWAAFDVGSTVAGGALPGVAEHALPTRPIGDFVARVDALVERASRSSRIAVVGAGAGGVELAFALRARTGAEVVLVDAGPRILPERSESLARRAARHARAAGIELRLGARVEAVEDGALRLAGAEALACDAVVWVAGAAAGPLFRDSGLPTDAAGFLRVGPTLQVVGHPELFAAGDCASLDGHALPKAGVYAVRAGPVLEDNLRRVAAGREPRAWRPQRDYLVLLNTADGAALGEKWGIAFGGRRVFDGKDRIDRRFVERFQVLGDDGAPRPGFPEMAGMDADEMPCGGCAAKVGAAALAEAPGRLPPADDPAVVMGLGAPDDAAAVATPRGDLVVASLDAFRAFTDDPWLVGRVAAVNAASDLWAKGVAPRFALAQVQVPDAESDRADEVLWQVLAGARAAFDPEGVTLVGGHSTTGPDLQVGFAVQGFGEGPDSLLRQGGLRPGDRLLLTKPLGTGVLLHADMRGLARGPWIEAAVASMLRSNAAAARVARAHGASAATDVSGFGLAGHLLEMLRAAKASARLGLGAVPLLPGAASLLARGLRSTFHAQNEEGQAAGAVVDTEAACPEELAALFDPQTSGGLLLGVPADRADAALDSLHAAGDAAATCIGEVVPAETGEARLVVGA